MFEYWYHKWLKKSKKALIKHTLDKEYFQSFLLICTPLRKLIYYTSSNIIQWFGQDIPPKIFLVETENCLKSLFATSCTLIEFNLHELHGHYSFCWKCRHFRYHTLMKIFLIANKDDDRVCNDFIIIYRNITF